VRSGGEEAERRAGRARGRRRRGRGRTLLVHERRLPRLGVHLVLVARHATRHLVGLAQALLVDLVRVGLVVLVRLVVVAAEVVDPGVAQLPREPYRVLDDLERFVCGREEVDGGASQRC